MSTNTLHAGQRLRGQGAAAVLALEDIEVDRGCRGSKMICSSFVVVPFLALYMLLDDTAAATLPSRLRHKRKVSWLEQEQPPTWVDGSDLRGLSVGDSGEMSRGVNSPAEAILTPREPPPAQRQNHRKSSDKRRKVAPLDSIGGFQMSKFRNKKDEPEIHWEYRE